MNSTETTWGTWEHFPGSLPIHLIICDPSAWLKPNVEHEWNSMLMERAVHLFEKTLSNPLVSIGGWKRWTLCIPYVTRIISTVRFFRFRSTDSADIPLVFHRDCLALPVMALITDGGRKLEVGHGSSWEAGCILDFRPDFQWLHVFKQ